MTGEDDNVGFNIEDLGAPKDIDKGDNQEHEEPKVQQNRPTYEEPKTGPRAIFRIDLSSSLLPAFLLLLFVFFLLLGLALSSHLFHGRLFILFDINRGGGRRRRHGCVVVVTAMLCSMQLVAYVQFLY